MKRNILSSLYLALTCVASLTLAACGSDEEETPGAPKIEIDEANIEGDELCVEADITAPGLTKSIVIEITDKRNSRVKASMSVTDKKYIGVRNIDDFHVHVPIAGCDVVVGDQLNLAVTDALGQATLTQKAITQEEDEDGHENN